jgi:hypothetical protein
VAEEVGDKIYNKIFCRNAKHYSQILDFHEKFTWQKHSSLFVPAHHDQEKKFHVMDTLGLHHNTLIIAMS